jgi:hypothetical protein
MGQDTNPVGFAQSVGHPIKNDLDFFDFLKRQRFSLKSSP